MDMKAQGSRSRKALGIAELLASACNASAPLDRSWICRHKNRAAINKKGLELGFLPKRMLFGPPKATFFVSLFHHAGI